MSINITVEGGKSKRLLTAGKYCPQDIVVTAEGGGSGGTVTYETCTVNLVRAGTATITAENLIFYALENGVPQLKQEHLPIPIQNMYTSVTCIKGSHLVIGEATTVNSDIAFTTTGSIELVRRNSGFTLGATFKINGDGTITQTV